MRVKLNIRGQIALAVMIVITSLSIVLRSPTLILFSSIGIAYLIAYPYMVKDYDSPDVSMEINLRHGILFRGEVDIIKIDVYNTSKSIIPLIKVNLKLPPSIFFVNRPSTYIFSLQGESQLAINIPVLPTSRGSHAIGPISLSIGDPFLFYEQEIQVIDQINLRVYPKRLGYNVSRSEKQRVFNRMIGLFSTRHKGFGTDFHGLRDYIRGDPSKIVDWAATARKNKLISREYEEERRLEVIIGLAAGTTTRGAKFDFMLGLTLDIFEGVVNANHPASIVIFDDEIRHEFKPTSSVRKKHQVWAQIYNMIPRDVHVDYKNFSNWVIKKGKTGDLVIVLGDLEDDFDKIENMIREIRARNNHVIFIDVWGYSFSYEAEVSDAALDHASDNYGIILANVIGRGIKQDNVFRGLEMKTRVRKYRAAFGFITGPNDNIVVALDRSLSSFFGKKWSIR